MTWRKLFSNPVGNPSSAEKAARRIREAATYLQGRPTELKRYDEPAGLKSPARERWLVTIKATRWGPGEMFWVYDDHILGARRRLPPRTKGMYDGDPVLAGIVDELDRALELVGTRKRPRKRK